MHSAIFSLTQNKHTKHTKHTTMAVQIQHLNALTNLVMLRSLQALHFWIDAMLPRTVLDEAGVGNT